MNGVQSLFDEPNLEAVPVSMSAKESRVPQNKSKKRTVRRPSSTQIRHPSLQVEEISLFPDPSSAPICDPTSAPIPPSPSPSADRKKKTSKSRWSPDKNFQIHTPSPLPSPEFYRVRRKTPCPDVLDELILKLIPALPLRAESRTLCSGPVHPSMVCCVSARSSCTLYFCEDSEAKKSVSQLDPLVDCLEGEEEAFSGASFDLIVSMQDEDTGRVLVEKILFLTKHLSPNGLLLVASPATHLLDYNTNVRNEAALMRDRVHRACRTHFILRPTAPLMNPAWDIIALSRRPSEAPAPKNRWRITGTGFLPWQKCNEAISAAPWLLVESYDQIAAAVARCVNYPWETFVLSSK
jgi:hypothetical protein